MLQLWGLLPASEYTTANEGVGQPQEGWGSQGGGGGNQKKGWGNQREGLCTCAMMMVGVDSWDHP